MHADDEPGDDPAFVVQHHHATADHYDFRLEIEGVLVSWAVPKGPSVDPVQRRLAKRVGDHDLQHASYEGVIAGAPHGRGTVQIWDHGTFRNTSSAGDASAGLHVGHLSFVLAGQKLRGGFSLIRTGGDLWLLLKKRDDHAGGDTPITIARPESVVSGRTMDEITDAGTG